MAFQYSDFQAQPASEKSVLATIDASTRLMGWSQVGSTSTYSIACAQTIIVAVEESGAAYAQGSSATTLTAGQYFLDSASQLLYVRSNASVNPNGLFVAATFRFFFANTPQTLPYDLGTGREVFWEPMVSSTSQFGVEIDVINQASEAIEGTGTLTLYNDHSFWPASFDQFIFENKPVSIYSYNRRLVASQAQLIFTGYVQKKAYDPTYVTFTLKDLLSDLKQPIPLQTIGSLGLRTPANLANAYQRMILGEVKGHLLLGTDQTLTGYPVPGTVSVLAGGTTVTGVGTTFLALLNPGDSLLLNGASYSIAAISSNTSLTISTALDGTVDLAGASTSVVAAAPKRWQNRTYLVAGHGLRTPTVQTMLGSSVGVLMLTSTADIKAGDSLYIGNYPTGLTATVQSVVNGTRLNLATTLPSIPVAGTTVIRPAVQNLRIDNLLLTYGRDYVVNSYGNRVLLLNNAEANAETLKQLTASATFTNGSAVVTGSGFKNNIVSSGLVGALGNAVMSEVLSVDSDTQLTLRAPWGFGTTTTALRFKSFVASESSKVSCDVIGRTIDGVPSSAFVGTGAGIVQMLLQDAGLGSVLDLTSFANAIATATQPLGVVVPATLSDKTPPTYRETINAISKSIFGTLVQTNNFKLQYGLIQPNKAVAALKLRESDILSLSATATSENMIQMATVNYQNREYDYLADGPTNQTASSTSDLSTYILKTTNSEVFDTLLVNSDDALRLAQRWTILLERSSGLISFTTKLQGQMIQVGDIVDISHQKLFTRFGATDNRRLVMVQKVLKDGLAVSVEGVDLSNMFNRVCTIGAGPSPYTSATADEKVYNGYVTDAYGMISNLPNTFGLNIIY